MSYGRGVSTSRRIRTRCDVVNQSRYSTWRCRLLIAHDVTMGHLSRSLFITSSGLSAIAELLVHIEMPFLNFRVELWTKFIASQSPDVHVPSHHPLDDVPGHKSLSETNFALHSSSKSAFRSASAVLFVSRQRWSLSYHAAIPPRLVWSGAQMTAVLDHLASPRGMSLRSPRALGCTTTTTRVGDPLINETTPRSLGYVEADLVQFEHNDNPMWKRSSSTCSFNRSGLRL